MKCSFVLLPDNGVNWILVNKLTETVLLFKGPKCPVRWFEGNGSPKFKCLLEEIVWRYLNTWNWVYRKPVELNLIDIERKWYNKGFDKYCQS